MTPGRGGLAVGDRGLEVAEGRCLGRQAHQSIEDLCSSGVRAGSVGADDLEHAVIGDHLGEGRTITVEQALLEPGDEEILRTVSAGERKSTRLTPSHGSSSYAGSSSQT